MIKMIKRINSYPVNSYIKRKIWLYKFWYSLGYILSYIPFTIFFIYTLPILLIKKSCRTIKQYTRRLTFKTFKEHIIDSDIFIVSCKNCGHRLYFEWDDFKKPIEVKKSKGKDEFCITWCLKCKKRD